MKILAIERDLAPIPAEIKEGILKNEAAQVWKMQQESVIREIYFHAERLQAVIILECSGVVEAELILSELPLVKNSYTTFDLYPLIAYPGYRRLFQK